MRKDEQEMEYRKREASVIRRANIESMEKGEMWIDPLGNVHLPPPRKWLVNNGTPDAHYE